MQARSLYCPRYSSESEKELGGRTGDKDRTRAFYEAAHESCA